MAVPAAYADRTVWGDSNGRLMCADHLPASARGDGATLHSDAYGRLDDVNITERFALMRDFGTRVLCEFCRADGDPRATS